MNYNVPNYQGAQQYGNQMPSWQVQRIAEIEQRMQPQYQQSQTMPRPQPQPQALECWPVSSREELNGIQARTDMQPTFYYDSKNNCIYEMKMGMDGNDNVTTYSIGAQQSPEAKEEAPIGYVTTDEFEAYKSEIQEMLGGMKDDAGNDASGAADNVGQRNRPKAKAGDANGATGAK